MKKGLILIGILISLMTMNVKAYELPEKTSHEKVTIHIFRGSGCSHCYDAMKYFTENYDELKDYLDFKVYEVSEAKNMEFLEAYLKSENMEYGGVPHIIIGSSYNKAGFAEYMAEGIVASAFEEYENPEYEDKVSKAAKEYKVKTTTLSQAWDEENGKTSSGGKYDIFIVISIFAVIIIGGVVFIKKSSN